MSLSGNQIFLLHDLIDLPAERMSHALTILRIALVEVADLQILDALLHLPKSARDVMEQALLGVHRHQAEKIPWLRIEVAIMLAMVKPPHRRTRIGSRTLLETRVFLRAAKAVRLVVRRSAAVVGERHRPIAVVRPKRTLWRIDGKLIVVDAQPVTMRIRVADQASLQHLVGREAHSRHNVAWLERSLLHFGKVILRIAIELEFADVDQRIVLVWPDLREVERIDVICRGLSLRHYLH